MKIAIIPGIFFPEPGGAQAQTHNLANKLREEGHEVDILLNRKTNLKNNEYKIFRLNNFIVSAVFAFQNWFNLDITFLLKYYLNNLIKKHKYDLWHFIFLNFKNLFIINCLKQLNQKIVVTFQGADVQIDKNINYGYRINKKYEKLFLKTLKNIDLFFCISKTIEKDVINLSVSLKKILRIPNTVEISKINLIKDNFKAQSQEYLKLITVARYAEKKKGFDLVENISRKLIEKNIKFKWTFIGKNTFKIKKNKFANAHEHYFNFIDNIENLDEKYFPNSKIIKKYLDSDLYVNLARIESFGLTFIESLACGVPIISFNTKGVNEIVKSHYNGFLVDNTNIEKMVELIKKIQENKDSIKNLRTNCTNSILKFDNTLITKKIAKHYVNLLN